MDDDGLGDEPVSIAVAVTVEGQHLTVDFAGTDPQRPSSINLSWQGLVAAVYYSFKALLDPDIPNVRGGTDEPPQPGASHATTVNSLASSSWRRQTRWSPKNPCRRTTGSPWPSR